MKKQIFYSRNQNHGLLPSGPVPKLACMRLTILSCSVGAVMRDDPSRRTIASHLPDEVLVHEL